MNEQRPLTEEELLAAAEQAYAMEQAAGEEIQPDPMVDLSDSAQPPVKEETTEEEAEPVPQAEEAEPAPQPAKQSVSTIGIALGITAGLLLGALAGFLTRSVPACLILGILIGVLAGLLWDLHRDKQSAAPATNQGEESDRSQPHEQDDTKENTPNE